MKIYIGKESISLVTACFLFEIYFVGNLYSLLGCHSASHVIKSPSESSTLCSLVLQERIRIQQSSKKTYEATAKKSQERKLGLEKR